MLKIHNNIRYNFIDFSVLSDCINRNKCKMYVNDILQNHKCFYRWDHKNNMLIIYASDFKAMDDIKEILKKFNNIYGF